MVQKEGGDKKFWSDVQGPEGAVSIDLQQYGQDLRNVINANGMELVSLANLGGGL